jgi:signal transduction histidine kinase
MSFVHTLFEINRDIIVFTYGLTFFVLGLVIALQSRNYSRLDLARSLSWLAAFGITHGLHEWGDLFIPLQAKYLSDPIVQLLNVVQLLLLGISFACLFEFGVTLLRPLGKARWLHGAPVGLLLFWLIGIFSVVLQLAPDFESWHHSANALARYWIGFPGGLLAAYGLRQQALRRIAPLEVPHIVKMLRIAGITLGVYAIFGGLIPPPAPFFPANLLNTHTFTQVIGIPPLIFRSLIGLILAITIIRALEVFNVETERMIEAMEQQQALASERERIARDLHDGVIQKVYTAGLLVGSAEKLAEPESTLARRLEKAQSALNDAIADLRRSLGELQAAHTSTTLEAGLRQLAQDPRFSSLVDISIDLDLTQTDALPPARAEHVLAIFQEALSNIVRHARARQVKVQAQLNDGRLKMVIEDDGVGLPPNFEASYGVRNMRDRARLLNGHLEITNSGNKGTMVSLDIPWSDDL